MIVEVDGDIKTSDACRELHESRESIPPIFYDSTEMNLMALHISLQRQGNENGKTARERRRRGSFRFRTLNHSAGLFLTIE